MTFYPDATTSTSDRLLFVGDGWLEVKRVPAPWADEDDFAYRFKDAADMIRWLHSDEETR